MNAKSLIWGIVGTVAWLLIIVLFAVLKGYELPNSLNELGDALAGIVAPIAFFWLILGYVQQGKQLDQNTKALEQQEKALNLQIAEMKESVKQQKALVDIQVQEINSMYRQVTPSLVVMNGFLEVRDVVGKETIYTLTTEIENIGIGHARNISVLNRKDKVLNTSLINKDQSLDRYTLKPEELVKFNIYLIENDFTDMPDSEKHGFLRLNIIFEDIYQNSFDEIYLGFIEKTNKTNIYRVYFK